MSDAARAGRPVQFCDDAMLDYAASRRMFAPGETLQFDATYRLAHLPLVAPDHPAVIADLQVAALMIHATNDDLALSGRPFITIDATTGATTRHEPA